NVHNAEDYFGYTPDAMVLGDVLKGVRIEGSLFDSNWPLPGPGCQRLHGLRWVWAMPQHRSLVSAILFPLSVWFAVILVLLASAPAPPLGPTKCPPGW